MQLQRRRLLAPALTYGLACLPQLGTRATAPLAKHDGAGCNSTPFFFAFHHSRIALDASYLLSSSLRQTLHHHPHRHRTRRVVLYNFPLSVARRAVLTISRSKSIFSPRLIRDYPCRRHHPHLHPHRQRTHHVLPMPSAPPGSSSTSYSSRRIVLYNFPLSVTWRAALTISRSTSIVSPYLLRDCPYCRHHPHRHPQRHRTRRVVSYNFLLRLSLLKLH